MAINEIHHFSDTTTNINDVKWPNMLFFDTTLDQWGGYKTNGTTLRMIFTTDSVRVPITNLAQLSLDSGGFVGLGATKGRIEFNDLATDTVNILGANVGIGDATPGDKLTIDQSLDGMVRVVVTNSNVGGTANEANFVAISDGNNAVMQSFGDSHSTKANTVEFGSTAGTTKVNFISVAIVALTIDASQNIGIGTATPSRLFDVLGSADNANFVALQIVNNDDPTTGQVGQAVSMDFVLKDTIDSGSTYLEQTAGRIQVGKVNDFFGAANDGDSDAFMNFLISVHGDLKCGLRLVQNNGLGESIMAGFDVALVDPKTRFHFRLGNASTTLTPTFTESFFLESTVNNYLYLIGGTASQVRLLFGDQDDDDIGSIIYDNSVNAMTLTTNALVRMTVDSSGRFGINDTGALSATLVVKNTQASNPVMQLNEAGSGGDNAFIDYVGTSAGDGTKSLSSDTTEDSAKGGAIRCEINGATKWIRFYDNES